PGGSAAASQEINSEIKKLREEGKVVVVSMADVAASGGYYIAAAADKILANPGTTTGSIGVIMQVTNLEELYEKIGMEIETIKSGEQKDIGNPARPMTEEERSILQSISNDIYDQFVDAVAEGRNLSRERVLELADGRIFTGRQAFELDLIDELGDLYDAVEKAAELAGLDQIVIKEYGKLSFWDVFLGGGVNHYDLHGNFMEELNLYRLIRGVEIK
ncbi:MAG: signal peptide peptidase SppA, partial [Firmicutes bacterium HGW-Firmicutes-13]